ncbi:unnamed protein product, partial [Clonostachys rhizophaga]
GLRQLSTGDRGTRKNIIPTPHSIYRWIGSYLPELITFNDNRRVKVAFILYFLKIDASYLPAKVKFCEWLCYFYSNFTSDWQGKPHPKDVMYSVHLARVIRQQ